MRVDLLKTAITIAAYLLSGANPASPPPGNAPAGARSVIGYYSEYYAGDSASYRSLTANLGSITGIASFSYHLNSEGILSGERPVKAVAAAKARGIKVLALVHNFTRAKGFDSSMIHAMLSRPAARARAVSGLISLVRSQGYDGINLDLENIPPGDRSNYTAFVRELASALRPAGYLVTASVPAKTVDQLNNSWSGAFDYRAISPWLDQVMLMTYDENASYGHAGPVASLPWVERVIRYARTAIPSRKIIVGLPAYGYDWVEGKTGAKAREFPSIQAMASRLGLTPRWDGKNQVPYLRYVSGGQSRIIWYENNWSASLKMDLVNRYDLGGIAIWRLGGEDPAIWPLIRSKLRAGV